MSENIKLSICIATLNRAAFIGETLDSIVSQVTDEVEVVIVDGASTDNTEEVVRGYQKKHACIRYFRLAAKGGVDRDYSRAVEWARGRYCWLFSDDDILLPGAIHAVLGSIESNYGLILVNSEIRSVDLSKVLKRCALDQREDRVYRAEDAEALFTDVASYLSFIGCVVIQKSLWDARDKESYFGTLFVHMGVIFQAPLACETLVLAKPFIAIRYGNAMWSGNSFGISLFKWPDLIWSFSAYSDRAKQAVSVREPWRSAAKLLIFRARGAYGPKEYEQFLAPRMHSRQSRLVAQMIARLPGTLVNLALCIYFSVFRRLHENAEIQLLDLRSSTFHYKKILK
ncbi:MAG: hypothetical protein A2Z93_04105 [Curvibacter sp. GWA2_64_110]|nr:MAG: hypothetical protein A2Z93_04105 [Curvibacter sp. GWA2_64_110]HCY16763.1 glycosyltransferase family 2 protein [Curvibacter sp.]